MKYHGWKSVVASGLLCLLVTGVWMTAGFAQEAKPAGPPAAGSQPAAGAASNPALDKVLERVSRLERELEALRAKTGQVPADKKDQRIVAVCETPYLGSLFYGSPTNVRFFAAKLLLVNLTGEPIALKREDVELSVDGQNSPIKDAPQQFQYHSFQLGQQTLQLRNLQMPKQLTVAAGGTGSAWILFPELPAGNDVPKLIVKLKLGEAVKEIDVNAAQRDRLGMKIERLGPSASLGLVTLSGPLDTISAGSLVEELDRLSTDKVARVVIRWTETAPPLDPQLVTWLQNSATASGRQQQSEMQFPPLPITIRELHLAGIPTDKNAGYDFQANGVAQRIHKTDVDAVLAALRSAYETLPRDELLQSIQSGNRLERAAALAGGAGRLAADKLPVILKYADDNDAVIQLAALVALGHFGEPEAIDKLLDYTKKNVEPLSSTAVASLAGSRYAAAHTALLDVLNNEAPAAKKNVVKVLARYPRPIWSEAIYEFVKDPRDGLNVEALNALVQVGHPKLVPLLEETLKGRDAGLKQQAFNFLANRSDRESEEIALNFTLEELKTTPATPPMLALLNRVKDKRALPLLAAQFNNSPNNQNKVGLIQTLAVIGDQETAKLLTEKYPALQSHEKGEVLKALQKLNSPGFRELAAQALLSPDSSLVGYAVQGLQEDGGPESVKIMIDALDKAVNSYTWSFLCNALAVAGTPAARSALIKARDSGNNEKRTYANGALAQLRQRSPGYNYVYQAQALGRQKKWKEAVEQYDMAIQLDPQLPEAYSGRANAFFMQEKFAEAGKDYAKASELDPFDSQAITGVCIVLVVVDGKLSEAVKKIEDARPKFPNNALFNYNAACTYGRAVEHLQKNDKLADRDKLIAQYKDAALADLKKAVELGFEDFAWMKDDPDLKALHQFPEFDKVATPPEPAAGAAPAQRARGIKLPRR